MKNALYTLFATFALSASAHATVLTNGSFETGDLSGWSTGISHPALVHANMVTTDGTHAAFLSGGYRSIYLQQTFATVANAVYRVDLDHGVLSSGTTGTRDDLLTILGTGNATLLSEAVASYGAFTAYNVPAYKHYSFQFTADGTEAVFRFETVGYTAFQATYLDNVSVTSLTAVPEPSSYAMMACAMLLLGGVAFRQRRA